jgi:hypothetical protein
MALARHRDGDVSLGKPWIETSVRHMNKLGQAELTPYRSGDRIDYAYAQ